MKSRDISIRFLALGFLTTFLWCGLKNTVVGTLDYKWRTCNESSFCTRLRTFEPKHSPYKFDMDSIDVITEEILIGKMVNTETHDVYDFLLQFLEHSTVQFMLNEAEETTYRDRFLPMIALAEKRSQQKFNSIEMSQKEIVIETETIQFVLNAEPAKLTFFHSYDKQKPALVVNDMGGLVVEYNQNETKLDKYHETFDGFLDTRPYGPMAVGADFSFPKAQKLYGLPMHLESLALQSSRHSDPYRLYNCDFANQKLHDKRAMYGSVPLAIAHGVNSTVGVFWFNSADTWVDVNVYNTTSSTQNVHFMSETGTLNAFFFLGPSFHNVVKQYAIITGKPPIPPYFSLGYHQSKWNYFSQKEVLEVIDNFDKNNFPLDVLWLDIEYTDQKKYFTWDPVNFTNPREIINTLAAKGRKLVVIIDPHIKKDLEYKVYKDGLEKGLFVHDSNGSVYYAKCWPGDSAWFDFINPEAREYWSNQYLLENFKDTTEDVFIWNDMNEPSVFNGPENTFPKDLLHFNNCEHRDIHNVYGLYEVAETYNGLIKRSKGQKRPFVLTRSYFAGIQRYAGIWLGDNYATYQSMKNSIAMCLTAALSGISFCGADVGGFFNLADPELLVRWYQLGAFLPFYREHSNLRVPGHEPYTQNEPEAKLIRQALQDRQILLPFWYTLFYLNSVYGRPVIRPLVLEYPNEEETFDIDYEYLIGGAILVRPLTEPGLTEAEVYFPGGEKEFWYPYLPHFEAQKGGKRSIKLKSDYNTTLVFIRKGCIIPKSADAEDKPLPSAQNVLNSDISLYIAPSEQDSAIGFLYLDDGESFAYQNNASLAIDFRFDKNTIRSRFSGENKFPVKQSVTLFEIAGERSIHKAVANVDGIEIPLVVESKPHITYLRAKKGEIPLSKEWTVTLE